MAVGEHAVRGDRFRLDQRGLIGDTETAALVAADGTIDWYCPRRFDAGAALFSLLDRDGGAVRVGPAGTRRAVGVQSYDAGTNVLRTVLPAVEGELEVTDFMPWDGSPFRPEGRIVRLVTARRGTVDVAVDVVPGRNFGSADRVTTWSEGMAFDGIVVRAAHPFADHRASFRLAAGERAVVTVDLADPDRHHEPLSVDSALVSLDTTAESWRRHAFGITYDGPHRDAVERSLLVIKALTFYGSGAMVAAPTTSLPEEIGGERNWDHRYSWLADAAAAVGVSGAVGLEDDAAGFAEWLAGILAENPLPLLTAYDIDGNPPQEEEELSLDGWRRSQPVRIGRPADERATLAGYAALIDVIDPEQHWGRMVDVADWLAAAWSHPDRSVADVVNGWYALRRMVDIARARNPLDLDAVGWHQSANEAGAWLEARFADGVSIEPDPALLALAWLGPWPSNQPPVVRTVDAIVDRFGPSFTSVRALAMLGRWDDAHAQMDALCGLPGPLGLLSAVPDPAAKALLGNYPSTSTHLALVTAARALASGPR